MLDTRVLVLNKSYFPVHIISVRRAFCMLYQGVAKVVNDQYETFDFASWSELSVMKNEDYVGLVNKVIKVPRVIVLIAYDRVPRRRVRFNRMNIYARDRNTCQYCGLTLSRRELNIDHVVPRSRGGKSVWENVVCSCLECNRRKGGRTPKEAGLNLIKPPHRPNWTPHMVPSIDRLRYEEWKPFINFIDASYWNTELEE